MNNSRTENSIRNAFFAFGNKLIALLAPFITRTVIISILGPKYLGLSGLFASILQILNLTELGFTSAIVYSLYKPLQENNYEKIAAIVNLIKSVYRIIGGSILVIGLCMMPFLKHLIKGECPPELSIYILFLIYLINTVVSYWFFSYRSCLLTATQRSDVKSKINSLVKILELILQIIIVIIWRNMYLYVGVQIFCTLLNNIVSYCVTKIMYPKYTCGGKLNVEEKKNIIFQILGIMADKICCVSRNSFDCIFVSAFFGLEIVAMYENYSYITNAAYSVVNVIIAALIASVGNSIATESENKNYQDMRKLMFLFAWLYGWIAICMLCLYQPFMQLWVGKKMMFPMETVLLFVFYFYTLCMGLVRAIYVQATGIWWKERNRAIVETIMNLLLNIILVRVCGINGIILGTCISLFVVNFIYGSKYIFLYYFKNEKIIDYYKSHMAYFLITILCGFVTWKICLICNLNLYFDFAFRVVVCLVVPNLIALVIVKKTQNWMYIKDIFKRLKMLCR